VQASRRRAAQLTRWPSCCASRFRARLVAVAAAAGRANAGASVQGEWYANIRIASQSSLRASGCTQRTAGPSCKQANPRCRRPVVSHTSLETAATMCSRPATLVAFTQPRGQSNPRALPPKGAPLHALARSASCCFAASPAMHPARCHHGHDKPASRRRTLDKRLRSRAAGGVCRPGCLRWASPQWSRRRRGQAAEGTAGCCGWRLWSCRVARSWTHQGYGWSPMHQPPPSLRPAALRWCYAGSRPTTRSRGRAEKRRWSLPAFRRRAP
jgi:hypothetical protein